MAGKQNPKKKVSANSIYRIASLSKSITATALIKICQDKGISLNDTISKFLPEVKEFLKIDSEFLISDFINMKAGIPHYYELLFDGETITEKEVMSKYGFSSGKDKGKFLYSNTSLTYAKLLVEKLSGLPFEDYLQEEVFEPSGMTNATSNYEKVRTKVLPAFVDSLQYEKAYYMQPIAGAGMYASFSDLIAYAQLHMQWADCDFYDVESQNFQYGKKIDQPLDYSGGFGVETSDYFKVLLADGRMFGGDCLIKLVPSHGFAIICMNNGSGFYSSEIADAVLNTLDSTYMTKHLPILRDYYVNDLLRDVEVLPKSYAANWKGKCHFDNKIVDTELIMNESEVTLVFNNSQKLILKNLQYNRGVYQAQIDAPYFFISDGLSNYNFSVEFNLINGKIEMILSEEKFDNSKALYKRPYKITLGKAN